MTIAGTGFTGATAVAFGGTAAVSFTVTTSTSLTATVGSGATGLITVTTPGGTASSTDTFTWVPAPIITSFTPSSGGTGTVVTITGSNFTGATAVTFGGTAAASFTVNTTISATVASGSSGPITVTTPGGTAVSGSVFTFSSSYNYSVMTAQTPAANTTAVYELGMAFESTANGQVTQIRYYKPSNETGTHTGHIWSSAGALLASATFTGETASGWQYASLATPLAITANTNYIVSVNSNSAYGYTINGLTLVNGPLTGEYGSYSTTPGTFPTTNSLFNYFRDIVFTAAAPTITSFTPTTGGAGAVVTITGTNFSGTSAVAIGGTAAASFTVTNATTITATLGSGSTGTISVTNCGGTAASTGTFTFIPAPTITSFTPTIGGAGTVVTITGSNFTGATAVKFGGTTAVFTIVSSTSITATVGNGSTGTLTVTTPGGTATGGSTFTWVPPPTITSFTPTLAYTGSTVTITGTNFTGATAVTLAAPRRPPSPSPVRLRSLRRWAPAPPGRSPSPRPAARRAPA